VCVSMCRACVRVQERVCARGGGGGLVVVVVMVVVMVVVVVVVVVVVMVVVMIVICYHALHMCKSNTLQSRNI
jgi:hypothetical protein